MHLPTAHDGAGWDALCDDEAALASGVRALLARHGLADAPRRRYDSGSLPVYAVGAAHVLKLFPPTEAVHASIEARTLAAVQGRLPIPTPRLVAADTHDGWPYVLMSRLHGARLVDAWSTLTAAERDAIADRLGETVAALHAIDTAPLADFTPRWDEFIARQRASAAARQTQRGLAPQWVAQVDAFLERWMPPPAPTCVLLHTELMREHLTVDRGALSGLFDFEPAMLGAPEYDFASMGLFVSCGDARLLRRTLRAYGYAPHALDEALQNRLMAYALLHRYSNLRWYLERLPAPGASTLEQLAATWWAL
ncbi:MAG TPA: aminoglycoside 3'-phosphotransferase/choline kinase family protein [Burkholderiaceae bacterium]|nr:aminoglycoside 3'-phosphotransferase/choline kinase family protein [Burkholderiaceae bacterium]